MLVGSPDEWFRSGWNLNTYRGCEHACNYCYARSHKYLIHSTEEAFDRTIFVKINAPQVLRRELEKLSKKGKKGIICFNSASDPYQPCEVKYKISRKVLGVIKDYHFPCHIMMKSDLILRDLDLLREVSERAWCTVSFTITTFELAELLEPKAPEPERRLNAMKKLSEEGVSTGILLMPIIPYLTDNKENIEEIVERGAESGAEYVIPGEMTLRDAQKERFMKLLEETFPELVEKYEALYKNSIPGEEYRSKVTEIIKSVCHKHKMPMRIPEPRIKRYVQSELLP